MKNEKGKMKSLVVLSFLFSLLFSLFSLLALTGCSQSVGISSAIEASVIQNPFSSFLDIPGVTAEEIAGIEAIKNKYESLVYGMPMSIEAFKSDDGDIQGFTALFCEWLTTLFQISFRPALYAWEDLLVGLEQRDIDFTGDLMAIEERRGTYFMTDAIAERSLAIFRMAGAPSLPMIAASRSLVFAFLENSVVFGSIAEAAEYDFEPVFVSDFSAAYEALESGGADAFLSAGISEASFIAYENVTSETFFPLVYNSVSLSTQNPDLAPIISVVQKALQHNGTHRYLADLYHAGNSEYRRYKLLTQFSADELEYVKSNKVVKFAAETDNYPISFYNIHEGVWQGVAHEVLSEVEDLTGLRFEIANPSDAPWVAVLGMLERGEVALLTELVRTDEREGRFLWPETAIMEDRAVLLSRYEYPNVALSDVLSLRIGVIRNSAYAELFRRRFPNHKDIREYDGIDYLLSALDSGEIELVMGRTNQYLNIVNYREILGYKINVIFNSYFRSSLGLHKDEIVLRSILDKSLRMIDTESIALNWAYKTHDYRYKLIEARLPWLISATALFFIALALLLVLFYRAHNERKRLTKLVAEETSTLTAILNGTPDHIFCKDLDSRYTRYNKSFKDYYKLQGSVIGKIDSEALGFPWEVAAFHKSIDKKVYAKGETVISEVFVPSPDGKETLFEVIKSPLINDGKITGLVGMARDITQRKVAEEEARKASEEARNASEAKSQFIANMSHEMRSPMNIIVGITDLMLEDDEVPATVKETLIKIETAGNTLMGLINDVLDISKIEAGKLELTPVQYDVASFLNDIITLNMVRIESKPILFKLDINEDLPCSLFGDDLRVKQLLDNLLSNAFKYTKEGTITLGVGCHRDGGDVWVSFYISDTGIGIRKEDLGKLFTDYHQVDIRANRKIEGTGLGLSISKKIVEMMNGEISVESEYGTGTIFRVRIRQGFISDRPLGKETVENLKSFRYADKKKLSQKTLALPDLSKTRVLVVDDLPANLDVAAGRLRKYKMQVDCVQSGQEAVDLIASGEPVYNAIFMDHMMPGMDGIEATKLIRALGTKYAEEIYIIALTANAVSGSDKMFLDNGFNAFLAKPFNIMSLDSVIQKLIRKMRNKK